MTGKKVQNCTFVTSCLRILEFHGHSQEITAVSCILSLTLRNCLPPRMCFPSKEKATQKKSYCFGGTVGLLWTTTISTAVSHTKCVLDQTLSCLVTYFVILIVGSTAQEEKVILTLWLKSIVQHKFLYFETFWSLEIVENNNKSTAANLLTLTCFYFLKPNYAFYGLFGK